MFVLRQDVEEVLGSIPDEYFAELFRCVSEELSDAVCMDKICIASDRLAKQITDFGADVEDEEQDWAATSQRP